MNYVKKSLFLFITGLLCSVINLCAYNVNLKGGEEIKEAAEILSTIISLHSIKILVLIVLGLTVAFQGIRMLINGIYQAIDGEQHGYTKGIWLSLVGIIFFCSGIVVIFKDELIGRFSVKNASVVQKVEVKKASNTLDRESADVEETVINKDDADSNKNKEA
ncbi:hypothetical protein E3J79_03645 [Candidatus Dependentiae bacterium]|nr:MAG: hypothetical protein E3J79_03645 [Candidatus Dependentiae bacterium]